MGRERNIRTRFVCQLLWQVAETILTCSEPSAGTSSPPSTCWSNGCSNTKSIAAVQKPRRGDFILIRTIRISCDRSTRAIALSSTYGDHARPVRPALPRAPPPEFSIIRQNHPCGPRNPYTHNSAKSAMAIRSVTLTALPSEEETQQVGHLCGYRSLSDRSNSFASVRALGLQP